MKKGPARELISRGALVTLDSGIERLARGHLVKRYGLFHVRFLFTEEVAIRHYLSNTN